MIDREQALEKIKKLLRMKRGGTQAEIETALALAQGIASKAGIDLDSVNPEEKLKSDLGHEPAFAGRYVPREVHYAAKIVERFFNVSVVYQRFYTAPHYRLLFIGRKFEIDIATYIFRFVHRHFDRSWRYRANRRLRSRKSFVYGVFLGLFHKLTLERKESQFVGDQAVILSRNHYIARHFGRVCLKQGKAPEITSKAVNEGISVGLQTSLRSAVNAESAQQTLLE